MFQTFSMSKPKDGEMKGQKTGQTEPGQEGAGSRRKGSLLGHFHAENVVKSWARESETSSIPHKDLYSLLEKLSEGYITQSAFPILKIFFF